MRSQWVQAQEGIGTESKAKLWIVPGSTVAVSDRNLAKVCERGGKAKVAWLADKNDPVENAKGSTGKESCWRDCCP